MDIMQFLLLAVLSFTMPGMTQQQDCGSENFPSKEQFVLSDTIDYLVPNGSDFIGDLVIVPQMKFNCHGYITHWHARMQLSSLNSAIDRLFHDITFQLWRPSAEDDLVYTFIGSNIFQFIGANLRAGLTIIEDGTQIFNLISAPPSEERLYFQSGDVIGWYIHTARQSVERPLTVVYRPATSGEPGVDMYSTVIDDTNRAETPPPCDVALYSSQAALIPSVIPYVTVEYVLQNTTLNTTHVNTHSCLNTTSYSTQPTTTTSSGDCSPITATVGILTTASSSEATSVTPTSTRFSALSLVVGVSLTLVIIIVSMTLAFLLIMCLTTKKSNRPTGYSAPTAEGQADDSLPPSIVRHTREKPADHEVRYVSMSQTLAL